MSNITLMNRNIALLQQDRSQATRDADDQIQAARTRQSDAKMQQLALNQEAGELKGDAQDASTRYQAVAAGLAAAGAACMLIPVVGQIIGAVLLAIAAVFAVLAHLESQGKQQQAAQKEQQAGLKEQAYEQEKNRVDQTKKREDERVQFVNEITEKQLEFQRQEGERAKF